MIRRLKRDVLAELPPKQTQRVTFPLDNRKVYDRAEIDFIRWLRETAGDAAARRARRAQAIVQMETLKRLSAAGKLAGVVDWIKDWLEGCDDKIVVFAHHQEVQESISQAFPGCARIVGGDATLSDAGKRRFQGDPDCRMIVCSLMAGGIGHTLTAAGAVAFVELPWTYASLEQAIDRVHRKDEIMEAAIAAGRTSVNVYLLLGDVTIDQDIERVIAQKEEVAAAAIDGESREAVKTADVAEEVMNRLTARRTS